MNKEQEEIFDEVYLAYADSHWTPPSNPNGKLLSEQLGSVIPIEHSKKSFINEIKTNPKFSKKWGLTIKERGLSLEERETLLLEIDDTFRTSTMQEVKLVLDEYNIPTKLITITYNDKTLESYE
jgi:hypothetical protein